MKACGVGFTLLLLFSTTAKIHAACDGEDFVYGRVGGYCTRDGTHTIGTVLRVGGDASVDPTRPVRNWVVLDLPRPQGRATSAQLTFYAVYSGQGPTFHYEVFDIVTDLQALTNGGTQLSGIYADLGEGVKYGERTFSLLPGEFAFSVPLNEQFLAQLNSGRTLIAVAGKLSTGSGNSNTLELLDSTYAQSVSLTISYDVSGRPFVMEPPLNITHLAGRPLTLNAGVCGAEPMTYRWLHNGRLLAGATNSVLTIPEPQLSDAGQYSVEARNLLGSATGVVASVTFETFVFEWQSYPTQPAYLGGSFYLQLHVDAGQPFDYAWLHNGTNLVGSGTSDGYVTLLRQNLTYDDAGQYLCLVNNEYGTELSPAVHVDVVAQAPHFVSQPTSTQISAGVTHYLSAHAQGGPRPEFQWYADDTIIPGATNGILELRSVRPEHSGTYRVLASNEVGTAWSEAALVTVVNLPPHIANLTNTAVVEGDIVRFTPRSYGSPPLTFRWLFNGAELPGETRPQLTLFNVTSEKAGNYSVIVSNAAGTFSSAPVSLTVNRPGPLDHWTRVVPHPSALYLHFTAFAENKLVAVGDGGAILVLGADGVWRNAPSPTLSDIRAVAYGNGVFVAVADDGILYSADGLEWAYAPYQFDQRPGDPSLAFGNGRFVIVATYNLGNGPIGYQPALTSVDGVNWQQDWISIPPSARNLRFTGGRFFAAHGFNLLSSVDGNCWSAAAFTNDISDVAFSNPDHRWVAVGDNGLIITSTDATNWVYATAPLSTRLLSVRYRNGVFVAVGARGGACYSRDGVNWSSGNTGTFDRLEDVAFADFGNLNRRFISVGEAGTMIASTDGINWFRENVGSTSDLEALTSGPGRLVAVGKDGLILTSTNALNFQQHGSGNTNLLHDVIYAHGQYLAVGDEGALARSTDGVNWTWASLGTNIYFKGVTYGEGRYIAVGNSGAIFASGDSAQWSRQPNASVSDLNAVAYGTNVFVAVGDNLRMLYSEDGTSWFNASREGGGRNLRDIVFVNNRFIAAGNDGVVYSSYNGFTWSYHPTGYFDEDFNLRSITYANGIYMIVGNRGAVLTSPDLQSWRRRRGHTPFNLHGVQPWGDRFVAIGNGGTVLLSASIQPIMTATRGGMSNLTLTLGGEPMVYRLQTSSDLADWSTVASLTNTQFQVQTTVSAPAESTRFFRAQTP